MADELKRKRRNPVASDMMDETMALIGAQPEVVETRIVVRDENDIQRHSDGTMTYKRFTMTTVGLVIPDGIEEPEWMEVGEVIKSLESSISWVVGDWADYANRVWGYKYEDIAKHFGYEQETLMTYGWVCRSVPTSIRNRGVYFGHARLVAPMQKTPELQSAWLQYVAVLHLRVKDMKDEIGLLSVMSLDAALDWLGKATTEIKRLIDYDQFRPKPKLKNKIDPEYEKAVTYRQYVDSAIDKIPYMDHFARVAFIERAEWLANYYAKLTEQAKTERET